MSELIKVATGQISHIKNGLCPDFVEGFSVRDPECQACRIISESEIQPQPDQPAAGQMSVDEFNSIHGPTFMGEPVLIDKKPRLKEFVEDDQGYFLYGDAAIRYLRDKLEKPQAQAEPVAYVDRYDLKHLADLGAAKIYPTQLDGTVPLYTHPAPREAVPTGWKIEMSDARQHFGGLTITSPNGASTTFWVEVGSSAWEVFKCFRSELAASPEQQGGDV